MEQQVKIVRVKEYQKYDSKIDSLYPHWNVWVSNKTGALKRIPFEDRKELDCFINAGEYTERVKEWLDDFHGLSYKSEGTYVITKDVVTWE